MPPLRMDPLLRYVTHVTHLRRVGCEPCCLRSCVATLLRSWGYTPSRAHACAQSNALVNEAAVWGGWGALCMAVASVVQRALLPALVDVQDVQSVVSAAHYDLVGVPVCRRAHGGAVAEVNTSTCTRAVAIKECPIVVESNVLASARAGQPVCAHQTRPLGQQANRPPLALASPIDTLARDRAPRLLQAWSQWPRLLWVRDPVSAAKPGWLARSTPSPQPRPPRATPARSRTGTYHSAYDPQRRCTCLRRAVRRGLPSSAPSVANNKRNAALQLH